MLQDTVLHTTGEFTTQDGLALFEQRWVVENAKANIALAHGYGEHSTRYAHVAAHLNTAGYSLFTYDHRAHGRSPGIRGYIDDLGAIVGDFGTFLDSRAVDFGERPLFLMGHSMGGLVLASYVIRHRPEVRGLVFSSAGVKVAEDLAPMVQKTSAILSRFLPKLPVLTLDPATVSREAEEVEKYAADPLNYHGRIQARTAHQMLSTIKDVEKRIDEIDLPLLVMHGTGDRLVEVEASQLLFDRASAKDKTLKLYEGAYHEVFNDLDRERFLDDLVGWLDERS